MIGLEPLSLKHCTQQYADWLNDPQVNQYLECRFQRQTVFGLRDAVREWMESEADYAYAILCDDAHIGNIKIGGLHHFHRSADIGYFIGDKSKWGQGYATEAIRLATKIAFDDLNICHLRAGVYESNVGSVKALLKAGYTAAGAWRKQLSGPNGREDHLWYERRA